MTPRSLALLTIVPLLAVEPWLSSAAGQSLPFTDRELTQELQQAQDLARQAGQHVLRSLQILGRDIPQFGLPFVDGDGNIVIPRRNPVAPGGTPVPAPGPSRT